MKNLFDGYRKLTMIALITTTATFALTGRVIDESGAPIENVHILSKRHKKEFKSDNNGKFSFSTSAVYTPKSHQCMDNNLIKLSSKQITIENPAHHTNLTIQHYSLNGQHAGIIFDAPVSPGIHHLALPKKHLHSGKSLFHISYGGKTYIRPFIFVDGNIFEPPSSAAHKTYSRSTSLAFSTTTNTTDTLIFSKDGYIQKRVTVENINHNLGAIRLFNNTFDVDLESMPHIDGSTTTISLSRLIYAHLLNISYKWKEPPEHNFDRTLWEIVPDTTDSIFYDQFVNHAPHSRTHGSNMIIINGNRKMSLVARIPSESELASADSMGVSLTWQPIALDALTIIINNDNPTQNLTHQNVLDIFSGTATHWLDVSDYDAVIKPYQRNPNSGSQEMMKSIVMKDTPIKSSFPTLEGMMSVFESLDYDPAGISFTPRYYLEVQVRDPHIHSVAINGYKPNIENIQERNYPYCAEVYAVTRATLPDTSQELKLLDWLLSPKGQEAIERSGYAPRYSRSSINEM